VEYQFSAWRGGIDVLFDALEADAAGMKIGDRLDEMAVRWRRERPRRSRPNLRPKARPKDYKLGNERSKSASPSGLHDVGHRCGVD
jgi:hypothetical protein